MMFECLLFGLARSLSISLSKFFALLLVLNSKVQRNTLTVISTWHVSKERMHYDQFGQRWHISAVFLLGRMRIFLFGHVFSI